MFKRIYPWQWNLQNQFCPLPHWIMPPVLIRHFPALTARSGMPGHCIQNNDPFPALQTNTNQCLVFIMLFFTSTSQQLELINILFSSPKNHIKLQRTTVSNIKSFPLTPALLYLSAKIHISGKSRKARNDVSFLSQAFRRVTVITNMFMMYSEHAKISFLLVFYCCFF